MMICLICRQDRLTRGYTTVRLDYKEFKLTITNVPADVCSHCAEAFVDDKVATRLLQIAEKCTDAGIMEDILDYSVDN